MRAVLQRVGSASVWVDGECRGAIDRGLLVLVGFEAADTPEDVGWMVGKTCRLRVFDDPQGVMNLSLLDIEGQILVVSQFTLHARTRKGNRPSYTDAAPPGVALPLYQLFLRELAHALGRPVASGRFGANMQVHLVNDGPVTITIDSKRRE